MPQGLEGSRRAGVSGAKKAWMVMEVDVGLADWLGSVGGGEALPIRPTVGRVCPAQRSLNGDGGERRITRLIWGVLGWRGVPNQAGNSAVVSEVNAVPLAQNTPALL
jgi:hypothetical protein